jgi:hypothetical protein
VGSIVTWGSVRGIIEWVGGESISVGGVSVEAEVAVIEGFIGAGE